ncbi:MAG: hypothetical protein IPP77_11820 [Bacteroidetes bacterium]|nr:hypothetical protein [Bacteroidota bacterium]
MDIKMLRVVAGTFMDSFGIRQYLKPLILILTIILIFWLLYYRFDREPSIWIAIGGTLVIIAVPLVFVIWLLLSKSQKMSNSIPQLMHSPPLEGILHAPGFKHNAEGIFGFINGYGLKLIPSIDIEGEVFLFVTTISPPKSDFTSVFMVDEEVFDVKDHGEYLAISSFMHNYNKKYNSEQLLVLLQSVTVKFRELGLEPWKLDG